MSIDEDKWPRIASAKYETEFDNRPYKTYRLNVRQHDDRRAIVYATYRLNPEFTEDGEGAQDALGRVLAPGEGITSAIKDIGHGIVGRREAHYEDVADDLIRECLADMPAEKLD